MSTSWKPFALAIILSAVSVALTRLSWPSFAPAPFFLTFAAVAATSHWGSGRAGLLATAICAGGLALLFPPTPPFGWNSPSLIIFVGISILGSRVIAGRNVAIAALRATMEQMRASEEQLRRAQKMEAVGQLAAGVAHNFNNLLQVTMGYTDILMDGIGDGEVNRTAVIEIRRATQRGAALTRQLMTFGRRHEARPGRIDFDATLGALRDILTRVIREDIELTMTLASGGAAVLMDPYDLEQVVINLVLNARDALPAGGRIDVNAVGDGDSVRVTVADNGVGMSPDVQAHLFEPFFTTKGVEQGTGLGLAFVHGVVHNNGGRVAVDSAPGKGTTVSVLLPVAPPESVPVGIPAVAPSLAPSSHHATILLVEDEAAVRKTTERILSRAGYRVIAATTPAQACELFAQHSDAIDLLLTDVVMPGMHGPALADQLRASRPDLPVVFVSGYSDVMPTAASRSSKDTFVPKPFAAASLIGAVEGVLAG